MHNVDERAGLEGIVELMARCRIKRVSVMCGGQPAGIVTRSDVKHATVGMAWVTPAASKANGAIRQRLLAKTKNEQWAPVAMTNVVARNGVAELWRAIGDDSRRAALKVAAENISGVKAVKDRMVRAEPASGMTIEVPQDAAQHSPA